VNLPMPSPVLPEQLMRLNARNGGASFGEEKSGAIRGVPPRPMKEVASLVLKGDFVDIRPLEWALLLRSGNVWEHSEASALTTQVCIAANSNAHGRCIAKCRAPLSVPGAIPETLENTPEPRQRKGANGG